MTTTDKDIIRRQLDRFGYDYKEHEQAFEVKLDFHLRTTIDLSKEDRVLLSAHLAGWNVLTGLPAKNLDRAILQFWPFTMLVIVVCGFGLFYDGWSMGAVRHNELLFAILCAGLLSMAFSSVYYLVKAEGFRQAVMGWLQERQLG